MSDHLSNNPSIPPQPYPDLRKVLGIFIDEVSKCLADNLIGIYLVGSLASGDFDLDSDVDFLVIIKNELTEDQAKSLQESQSRIYEINSYPAKHLEGSFITRENLNNWETIGIQQLHYFDNGSTTLEHSTHDNNWHVRWILRERGVRLIGPAPEMLLEPIPVEKLRGEARRNICEVKDHFEAEIDHPLSFMNSEFGQSFIVLTCCRILQTLETGTVQSKIAAVGWGVDNLDVKWQDFILQAWEAREGVRFGGKIGRKANRELLVRTLAFVQYCITQVKGQ